MDLVHLALNDLHYYYYGPSGPPHYLSSYLTKFIKRLNKGTNGRYRGKLPLICFNCDCIGHFSNKCTHKKKRNDEGYSKDRQTYKGKRTTKKVFKKRFCTKEDISSSDEDEFSDSEIGRVLFMEVEEFYKEDSKG